MKTILLVEDNVSLRNLYIDVLSSEGFNILAAADGEQGEKLILEDNWDLLLLDIMLPKLDGLSILKDLDKRGITKSKPVLIISNINDEVLKKDCNRLNIKEFIIKSDVNLGEFVEKIKSYLPLAQ